MRRATESDASRRGKPAADAGRRYFNLTAFLSAFCLFLSTIEYMIPKPLPFMRLGIANLPIILALDIMPVPQVLLLVLLKVVCQSLVSGSLFSYIFLFSFAGSFASGLVMIAARKAGGKAISFVGVSVLGAVASNLVQIVLARYFIFGESAWYIGPPFVAVGLATGILLGLFCEEFARRSTWYASMKGARR
jgi:heptaprenyl diphosphate synthase